MKKGYFKRIIICALAVLMAASAIGCSKTVSQEPLADSSEPKEITIKFFSNLPTDQPEMVSWNRL